jgi:hypothetical protein
VRAYVKGSPVYKRATRVEVLRGVADGGHEVSIEVWRDLHPGRPVDRAWLVYVQASTVVHRVMYSGPTRMKELEIELAASRVLMADSHKPKEAT